MRDYVRLSIEGYEFSMLGCDCSLYLGWTPETIVAKVACPIAVR